MVRFVDCVPWATSLPVLLLTACDYFTGNRIRAISPGAAAGFHPPCCFWRYMAGCIKPVKQYDGVAMAFALLPPLYSLGSGCYTYVKKGVVGGEQAMCSTHPDGWTINTDINGHAVALHYGSTPSTGLRVCFMVSSIKCPATTWLICFTLRVARFAHVRPSGQPSSDKFGAFFCVLNSLFVLTSVLITFCAMGNGIPPMYLLVSLFPYAAHITTSHTHHHCYTNNMLFCTLCPSPAMPPHACVAPLQNTLSLLGRAPPAPPMPRPRPRRTWG